MAEAEAILRGLQFALDLGLLPVTIESDTVMVVKWINGGSYCGVDVGLVLNKINTLIRSLGCGAVNSMPQKANQVAHFLAKKMLISDPIWFN